MKSFYIDDITWNDLDMDEVIKRIDSSSSSVGSEYIRKALRNLLYDKEALSKRNSRSEYFKQNGKDAEALKKIFKSLGRVKKISFYDHIFRLKELERKSNAVHYILILALLCAIALIFIKPAFGIIAIVVMISVNIILYFRQKARIEGYFICFKYLVSMVKSAQAVLKKADLNDECFDDIKEDLSGCVKALKDLKRGAWLLTNSVSGSIVDVIMDYIRMIFHVDLIRFNQMQKKAIGHEEEIDSLYNALGELELALSVCAYKERLLYYCRPSFENAVSIGAEDIYHPLIKEPVPNSIDAKGSVLFTGSNASGKSTFLKTLAIDQILAQSLGFALASSYKTTFFKVLSSMALSDNILGNESYFVVEIKSLKRIFDELGADPVLCFIDEVLRGTNTKERIAASSQILKKLTKENALVFAATHDIELTEMLRENMTNLHFSETVNGNEVIFDYKIRKGPADSRNAIKLLEIYGFDSEIISEAIKMCLP